MKVLVPWVLFLLAVSYASGQEAIVSGRVLDRTGAPVAGAVVCLCTGHRSTTFPKMLDSRAYAPSRRLQTTRSDSKGLYQLTLVPERRPPFATDLIVSGWVGARCFGVRSFDPTARDSARSFDLRESQGSPARVRVLDHSGRPLVGARIVVRAFRVLNGTWLLPEEESIPRPTAVTDATGEAVLSDVASERLFAVSIEHERCGVQWVEAFQNESLNDIRVRSAGRVVLTGGTPGQLVDVVTRGAERSGAIDFLKDQCLTGRARVRLDQTGGFVLSALAHGRVSIEPIATEDTVTVTPDKILHEGEETPIALSRKALRDVTVRVLGSDGRKVPHVHLRLRSHPLWIFAATDASGTIRVRVLSGPVSISVESHSAPYGLPDQEVFGKQFLVPNDDAPCEVVLELPVGRAIVGTAVDPAGRPVPYARVVARWDQGDRAAGRMESGGSSVAFTTTRSDGSFRLAGLPTEEHVRVESFTRDRKTAVPVPLSADRNLTLTLMPAPDAPRASLSVTVVDERGQGLPSAHVALWMRRRPEPRVINASYEVVRDDGIPVSSDAEGRIAYLGRLERGHSYAVLVTGDGLLPTLSRWISLETDDEPGEILLSVRVRRTAPVVGRVLDHEGAVVVGARIIPFGSQKSAENVLTDEAGRFRLASLVGGSPLLVVAARRTVPLVTPDPLPEFLELTLPPEIADSEESTDATARERADLLRDLFDGRNDAEPTDPRSRRRRLTQLLVANPTLGLVRLEESAFSASDREAILDDYAKHVAFEDPLAAMAIAASFVDRTRRCLSFLRVLEFLRPADGLERERCLLEAFLTARDVESPALRLALLARVAGAYEKASEQGTARRILDLARSLSEALHASDWPLYARSRYATFLAPFDLDSALSILADNTDSFSFDRHHGNTAHGLAGIDPVAAERVLMMVKDPNRRARWGARVVHGMASLDPERALRIARSFATEGQRAFGIGMAALVISRKDPTRAKSLFEEVLSLLAGHDDGRTAAFFLPHVAGIDSSLAAGFALEAAGASTRGELRFDIEEWFREVRDGLRVAMLVSCHDRALGHALFVQVAPDVQALLSARHDELTPVLGRAVGRFDPARIPELIESLPADPTDQVQRPRDVFRRTAIDVLLWNEQEFRNVLLRESALWVIGEEDL